VDENSNKEDYSDEDSSDEDEDEDQDDDVDVDVDHKSFYNFYDFHHFRIDGGDYNHAHDETVTFQSQLEEYGFTSSRKPTPLLPQRGAPILAHATDHNLKSQTQRQYLLYCTYAESPLLV
jgi:hypothetical protein